MSAENGQRWGGGDLRVRNGGESGRDGQEETRGAHIQAANNAIYARHIQHSRHLMAIGRSLRLPYHPPQGPGACILSGANPALQDWSPPDPSAAAAARVSEGPYVPRSWHVRKEIQPGPHLRLLSRTNPEALPFDIYKATVEDGHATSENGAPLSFQAWLGSREMQRKQYQRPAAVTTIYEEIDRDATPRPQWFQKQDAHTRGDGYLDDDDGNLTPKASDYPAGVSSQSSDEDFDESVHRDWREIAESAKAHLAKVRDDAAAAEEDEYEDESDGDIEIITERKDTPESEGGLFLSP